jgi:hypothetical protein
MSMATFEEMREKHRKDSMLTFSFFLFLILIFIFHIQYVNAVRELTSEPETLPEVFKKSWLITIFTLIGPFAIYFLGILTIAKRDIYYSVDNLIFKKRLKVDRYICQEILNFRIGLEEEDERNLQALKDISSQQIKCEQLMRLFYYYVEKKDVVNPELKSQAFTYWGDYFSSMMFAVWGILSLLITTLIMLSDKSVTYLRLAIILIMVALIALNLFGILVGKTAKKLFKIPETQIHEIHRNAAQHLLADLKKEGFFLT